MELHQGAQTVTADVAPAIFVYAALLNSGFVS
jgi:hypothetical protein